MLKNIFGKRGMTLIEVLIAMVIMSVFTVSLVGIFGPMLENFQKTKELSDAYVLAGTIEDIISRELELAENITPVSGDAVSYLSYGRTGARLSCAGRLEKNSVPMLDDAYYKGITVFARFTPEPETVNVALSFVGGSALGGDNFSWNFDIRKVKME